MSNSKKDTTYRFDMQGNSPPIGNKFLMPQNRYKGVSRLYQLNLSKMLLKCPDQMSPFAPFKNKDHHSETPQEIIIVSSKPVQKLNQQKKTSKIEAFLRRDKAKHSKQLSKQKINSNQVKACAKRFENAALEFIKKQLNQDQQIRQLLMNEQSQEESQGRLSKYNTSNQQPASTHLFISQKKIHDTIRQANKPRPTHFSPDKLNHIKKHNFHNNHILNPRAKSIKPRDVQLPQLRKKQKKNSQPSTKIQQNLPNSVTSNIQILVRDNQQLKMVKSQSYVVMQYPSKNVVLSHRAMNSLQIASLTKIMTFYCVRQILKLKRSNISQQKVTITDKAMDMSGTSAQILSGQIYSVEQLLYGLMLPSGNDAATALAEWGGGYLLQNANEISKLMTIKFPNSEEEKNKIKAFVIVMNYYSKQLGMSSTRFANPHGLPNPEGKSTATDVAKLCSQCLDDQLFIKVTSTQNYKCIITNIQNSKRNVQWINTNKLLRRDNFVGIKTGITVTAGPCLASAYKFRDKIYITIILRASKPSRRFKQTRKILYCCLQKLYKDSMTSEQKKTLLNLKKNRPEFDSDYSQDEHVFNYDITSSSQLRKRLNFINFQM